MNDSVNIEMEINSGGIFGSGFILRKTIAAVTGKIYVKGFLQL